MIVSLNQMNNEQIKRYDELFALVCKSFVDEFKKLDIPNNYETEISDSRIESLIKCTTALNIPSSEHTLIVNNITRLKKNFEAYLSPITLEVMFPVFFFAAVLKNEFKPNTILQRERRGTANWGKTNNLVTNVEELFDVVNGDRETTFNNKLKELEELYLGYINKNNRKTIVSTEIDEHVRNALALKDKYSDISKIQNKAKIGLFALKILNAEHSPTAPMMTLARMYVIDQICGLNHFEDISNGFPVSYIDSGNLISRYYNNDEPYMERQLSKHGFGYLRKAKKIDRIDLSKTLNVFSEEKYEKLKNASTLNLREELLFWTVLSDQEVKKIQDYYLNNDKLQWYADYYTKIIEYLYQMFLPFLAE